jgi:hypothetical protein
MNPVDAALRVQNQELLATAMFELPWLVACGWVVYRCDRHVRRRGYQSPFRALAAVTAFAGIIALGIYADLSAPGRCGTCSAAANPEYYRPELVGQHVWLGVSRFYLATTVGVGLVAAASAAVPRRARRFGERRVRFPWRPAACR